MASQISLPSGYAYATIHFSGAGYKKGAMTTLGAKTPGTTTSASDFADALTLALTSAATTPLTSWPNTLKVDSVTTKLGPVASGDYHVKPANITLGSAATDPYSPNCATLVSRRTAGGGRKARGRMFLPPPVEASIDASGALAAGTVTAIQSFIDTVTTSLTAAGWAPYLIHRWNPAGGGSAPVPTAITTHTVEPYVATLRHRLVRR